MLHTHPYKIGLSLQNQSNHYNIFYKRNIHTEILGRISSNIKFENLETMLSSKQVINDTKIL